MGKDNIEILLGVKVDGEGKIKTLRQNIGFLQNSMRMFTTQMLSVLFFGMAMKNLFIGLLQPIMQTFGVFELWNNMLMLLFLPIMIAIFPFLLKLMEWFMTLPENVQFAIGVLAILAVVIGTLMSAVASILLPLAAIFGAGGIMAGITAILAPVIAFISGPLLIPILLIIAAVLLLRKIWSENWGGIRDKVSEVWNAISPIFESFGRLFGAVGKVFGAVGNLIVTALAWIANYISNSPIGQFWESLWNGIVDSIKWAWSIVQPIVESIIEAINWVADRINGWSGNIGSGDTSIVPSVASSAAGATSRVVSNTINAEININKDQDLDEMKRQLDAYMEDLNTLSSAPTTY